MTSGGKIAAPAAPKRGWYVLKVFTSKEEAVKDYLEQQVKYLRLEERIGEVLIPTETVIEMRDGKRRDKKRVFFPGYLLIEMELTPDVKYMLINSPNVMGFAGDPQDPQPLRKEEVDRVLGRVEEKRGQVLIEIPFQTEDKVKIIDGPFKDFIGSIKEINEERRKLKVLVSIFGRSTPVEVDFLQVTTSITQ
jgi:transcriptional antiterminator NusG